MLVAHFLRWKAPLWFRIHQALQVSGLCVAIVGWAIALSQFEVLEGKSTKKSLAHAGCAVGRRPCRPAPPAKRGPPPPTRRPIRPRGRLGMVVMCLGLIQPINGVLRPHKPAVGEPKSAARAVWEVPHAPLRRRSHARTAALLPLAPPDLPGCTWRPRGTGRTASLGTWRRWCTA